MKKVLFAILLAASIVSCTKEAPETYISKQYANRNYNNQNGTDTTQTTPTPERRF